MKERTASLLIILVSMLWGGGFIGTRICLQSGMLPYQILFFRFLFATVLLWAIYYKKIKTIRKRTFFIGMILGVVTAASYIFEMKAMVLIDTNKVSLLESTGMVWFMILICLYYQVRPTIYSLIIVVFSVVGVAFVGGSDFSSLAGGFGAGEVFALMCAAVCGLNLFLIITVCKGLDAVSMTMVQMLSCAAVMFIMNMTNSGPVNFEPSGYLGLAFLVIFPTCVCFVLKNRVVRYVPAIKASLLSSTETIFCAIMSILILHEVMTLKSILGAILIFTAIVIDILHPLLPEGKTKTKDEITARKNSEV